MYSYIKGVITEVCATHITIESNGIGYLIKVPNPYQFNVGTNSTIYVYQNVREDLIELYGFQSNDEKSSFINLISVRGLGPKGALAILASSTISEIHDAVLNNNSKYFINFPGIGPKLSEQIILDLKGKINFEKNLTAKNADDKLDNVIIALKSLGYNQAEIKAVTKHLHIDKNTPLSDAVKTALQLIKK